MAKHRTKYLHPFKTEVIQFLLQTGRSVTPIAKELEVDNKTLSNWVKAQKLNPFDWLKALTPLESASVSEMEHETRRLRMENKFQKTAAFITKMQN